MKSPAVSVIMNCLNGERHLPAALDCLARQTSQDFEIIFLDNGSTDASPELAKSFGRQLRYYRNAETVPLGAARNQAIAKSGGEFVAFLDCDDLWLPEKLEKQLELFRSSSALGLVCTDTEIFRDGTTLSRVFETSPPARGKVFVELMERQWISMSSAMLRRKALDSVRENGSGEAPGAWFDERLNVCEEADLFYRIAHDWELDYVPEVLTRWRVHGRNTTFRKFHQFSTETRLILEKQKQLYPAYEREHGKLIELMEKRAAFQGALAMWRSGQGNEARKTIVPYLDKGRKYRLFWLATFLPGSLFDILGNLYFSLPASWRR